ncbi:MAG: hypothetical protein Q8O39_02340 [bacterium]|nr:hypothetical protein [bacterium]
MNPKGFSNILIIGLVVLFLAGGTGFFYLWNKNKQTEENLQTTKLFTIPEKHECFSLIIGPDNKQFAYVVGQQYEQGKKFVVVNGNEHKKYDYIDIDSLSFSSGGKHFVYIAANDVIWPYKSPALAGGKWWVVIDGVEQKEYNNIHSFTFSADGEQFAYVASKSTYKLSSNIVYAAGDNLDYKEFIVLNGKEQKNYYRIHSPVFSPDNSRFAFIGAQEQGKEFLVLDGEEQENLYGRIHSLSFSADGQQIAYVTILSSWPISTQILVLNGVEQKRYNSIDEVVFHPGGKFTYRGYDGETNHFLVVDKKEYKNGKSPVFSQNNKHFAYVLSEAKNSAMVLDGTAQQNGSNIISPVVFSEDGKHYIYVVRPMGPDYLQKGTSKAFVVVDGIAKPETNADNIIFPTLSSDGKNFSYVVQKYNTMSYIIINEEGLSQNKKGWYQYDQVWQPIFTKDGKNLIYNALVGREIWLIVNSVN